MADPLIGAEAFIRIDRDHAPIQEEVREISRPNVDGIGLQKIGTRGRSFSLQAIRDFETETAYRTTLANLLALEGTITSWTNNEGTNFAGLAVQTVTVQRKRRCQSAVGGLVGTGQTLVVTFRVRCIDTRTP
jgi:hypothetical protein